MCHDLARKPEEKLIGWFAVVRGIRRTGVDCVPVPEHLALRGQSGCLSLDTVGPTEILQVESPILMAMLAVAAAAALVIVVVIELSIAIVVEAIAIAVELPISILIVGRVYFLSGF